MVLRKIDSRVRVLLENGVNLGHRSLVVVVGDAGRDQVPVLHHMLSQARVGARPNVLWGYNKELGFSSAAAGARNKKAQRAMEKKVKGARINVNEDDPFELFVATTRVHYCYYRQTDRVLGRTFGMCVLQDFEALTPNILARTMETVEGGGVIVVLLKTVQSLRQLFVLSMDVHARYRTEAHKDVVGRFNERLILSLASNVACIVTDDQLNILPLSSHIENLKEAPAKSAEEETSDLKEVKDKFRDSQPTGSLINLCRTLDQAKALLEFIDAITDKKLDRTVSLTAARGRGKSAALGLAVAAAVGFGYSNIFVSSPSPENLGTLFDFIFRGFDAMEYEEHTDYDLVKSTNPEFNNAIVRVNVHEQSDRSGGHRQTIQYLHPSDAQKLGQAELVVIDEAAAIPLPIVKQLLGPYLVFMSSTINGYEGTGRSLSLKLLEQLRKQSSVTSAVEQKSAITCRSLREVVLEESIRYRPGDAVESWLNRLLCLDATTVRLLNTGCPKPDDCDLYYVNRDALFSYHKGSEEFLQRIVSLFVSSHYKNSPNDLQMMSDAPAHHIFCLLGPTDKDSKRLPEVLCVVQVCLEGEISRKSIMHGLSRGKRADGDLIPWAMAQQYNDDNFPSLSGARVVRIATHPNYQRMGYGKKTMQLLQRYYEMKVPSLAERDVDIEKEVETVKDRDVGLLEEHIGPRANLPPLLFKLDERRPERLDYLGVSYGLTQELLRFWKGCGFTPTYLRQTTNDVTGEHTNIMLKLLDHGQEEEERPRWLTEFWKDFRRRIVHLLGYEFRKFPARLVLSILSQPERTQPRAAVVDRLTDEEIAREISPFDLKRLEAYTRNLADYHLIMDLMPKLAKMYFLNQLGVEVKLQAMQEAILIGIGLQCKSVKELCADLDVLQNQLLGLFTAMVTKLMKHLRGVAETAITNKIAMEMPKAKENVPTEALVPLADELQRVGDELKDELKAKQKKKKKETKQAIMSDKFGNLSQYAIKGDDSAWNQALDEKGGTKALVSVKSGEVKKRKTEEEVDNGDDGADTPFKKKKKKSKEHKQKKHKA